MYLCHFKSLIITSSIVFGDFSWDRMRYTPCWKSPDNRKNYIFIYDIIFLISGKKPHLYKVWRGSLLKPSTWRTCTYHQGSTNYSVLQVVLIWALLTIIQHLQCTRIAFDIQYIYYNVEGGDLRRMGVY